MLMVAYAILTLLGLLVGWFVSTLMRGRDGSRGVGAIAAGVVAFGAVAGFGQAFVIPQLQARQQAAQIEGVLRKNVAFDALARHDPLAFANFVNPLKKATREGARQPEVVALATSMLTSLVRQRVAQASDASALRFMGGYAELVTEVQKKDMIACYRMMRPQPGQNAALEKFISPELLEKQTQAMAEVIRSASSAPQLVPTDADVQPLIPPLLAELARLYGRDVALAVQAPRSTADQERICQIEASFLRLALRLPPPDASRLVRYLAHKADQAQQ